MIEDSCPIDGIKDDTFTEHNEIDEFNSYVLSYPQSSCPKRKSLVVDGRTLK